MKARVVLEDRCSVNGGSPMTLISPGLRLLAESLVSGFPSKATVKVHFNLISPE